MKPISIYRNPWWCWIPDLPYYLRLIITLGGRGVDPSEPPTPFIVDFLLASMCSRFRSRTTCIWLSHLIWISSYSSQLLRARILTGGTSMLWSFLPLGVPGRRGSSVLPFALWPFLLDRGLRPLGLHSFLLPLPLWLLGLLLHFLLLLRVLGPALTGLCRVFLFFFIFKYLLSLYLSRPWSRYLSLPYSKIHLQVYSSQTCGQGGEFPHLTECIWSSNRS